MFKLLHEQAKLGTTANTTKERRETRKYYKKNYENQGHFAKGQTPVQTNHVGQRNKGVLRPEGNPLKQNQNGKKNEYKHY